MIPQDTETRTRIRDYLWGQEGPQRGTSLQAIEDIIKVGRHHGLDVWQARLVFADHEMSVWVVPEPVTNYYLHRGHVSDQQTEIGSPEAAATFHIGLMMVLQERQRRRRLEELEAQETRAARGSNGRVIRADKNTKVSVLAEQIIERILDQGIVELEAMGAGAVNQAVKACPEQGRRAVARARQTLEPEGYMLVIIPDLMQVPLGHGSQAVIHLTVVDIYGG